MITVYGSLGMVSIQHRSGRRLYKPPSAMLNMFIEFGVPIRVMHYHLPGLITRGVQSTRKRACTHASSNLTLGFVFVISNLIFVSFGGARERATKSIGHNELLGLGD